jgi:hypothetical protein
VIFYKGQPLVIDSGRFKYTDDQVSQNQIIAKGHFIPFSFKEEWDFSIGSPLINNKYFKSNVSIDLISENKLVIIISNWNSQLIIKRTFLLLDDKLVIKDKCIKGKDVYASLNLPFKKESVNVKNNSFTFNDVELQINNYSSISKIDLSNGYYSSSYGVLETGSKITTSLNSNIEYIFKKK